MVIQGSLEHIILVADDEDREACILEVVLAYGIILLVRLTLVRALQDHTKYVDLSQSYRNLSRPPPAWDAFTVKAKVSRTAPYHTPGLLQHG